MQNIFILVNKRVTISLTPNTFHLNSLEWAFFEKCTRIRHFILRNFLALFLHICTPSNRLLSRMGNKSHNFAFATAKDAKTCIWLRVFVVFLHFQSFFFSLNLAIRHVWTLSNGSFHLNYPEENPKKFQFLIASKPKTIAPNCNQTKQNRTSDKFSSIKHWLGISWIHVCVCVCRDRVLMVWYGKSR